MVVCFCFAFTAFGTFLIKKFFMTIPDSLIDVARIAGAEGFFIFGQIIIPLSKPVIGTISINRPVAYFL